MPSVAGRNILVVEDEAAISLDLKGAVEALGATVIGPCASVGTALDALGRHRVDCALLDIQLGTQRSDAIAVALRSLKIPFIFVTGYSEAKVPQGFEDQPMVQKPYEPQRLLTLIADIFRDG